ncbi:MAG: CAP domain-containing protein [Candidatus Polarisedimenticolia bacterium]
MELRTAWMVTAVVMAGVLMPCAAAGKPPAAGASERRLLDLVNAERSQRGLRRLKWDEELARLARLHAEDMRRAGRVSHASRDGTTYEGRLVRAGYSARAAAENVALDRNVERAHAGLMDSSGHRKNILDRGLTAIGIGVVKDSSGDSIYVVQDFSDPMVVLSDQEAVRRVRLAAAEARRGANLQALEERPSVSRSLESTLRSLIGKDTVKVDKGVLPGPGWVVAYTSPDPSELPDEARRRLQKKVSGVYGIAAAFARTKSQPFGAYWVVLGILEDQ